MTYALVGVCAFMICLIINKDLIFVKSSKNLPSYYKIFKLLIFSNLLFYLSDILWGILDNYHIMTALYVDTVVYFLAQALCIFFWTVFVASYINRNKVLNIFLIVTGTVMGISLIISLFINSFVKPIIFTFDDANQYISLPGRKIYFILQIILFVSTLLAALIITFRMEKSPARNRCMSVTVFCLFMTLTIIAQIIFPLLPLYAAGTITSNCLVHVFIIMAEKEEQEVKLKDSLLREQHQRQELENARALLYVDQLTGAQSKFAYLKLEDSIDKLLKDNMISKFAVIVFDINGLKHINDTLGHDHGDQYIINSYKIIETVFKNIPIYRFGGDEFVIFLENDDYLKRDSLLREFEKIIDNNLGTDNPVLSTGMAEYNNLVDDTFESVFIKADEKMYERKKYLKSKGSIIRE